jgi:aromatic-amino-acid transaminase
MSIQSMAANHAAGKGSEPDSVFAVVSSVRAAKQQPGAEMIVDGSIGAIHDEAGNFSVLPIVDELYRQLSPDELMNYATIAGSPEFLQAAIDYTFQGFQPEDTIAKAVGSPGGTGAIRMMIYNYLENGEKVLIPDWHWAPYKTIAEENQRLTKTYAMFDSNLQFTTEDIKAKTKALLKQQDHLLVIFNTPGHNPTGYSLSLEDWADLIPFFKECAQDPTKRIIIGLDMAYVDYSGDPREARRFLSMFKGMPENMMVTIAFSMSKSFLVYGMRCGALIGISPSAAVMEDFAHIHSFSGRGVWSNGSRGAQQLLAKIVRDADLTKKANVQRNALAQLVSDRAAIFVKEASEVSLKILPYFGGFFITIPAKQPKKLTAFLAQEKIFLVPMSKGIRLAVCAVPKAKVPGLAARIKKAMDNIGEA